MKKRLLSILLVLAVYLGLLPTAARMSMSRSAPRFPICPVRL